MDVCQSMDFLLLSAAIIIFWNLCQYWEFVISITVGNVLEFAPLSRLLRRCAIVGTLLFPPLSGVFWNLCHYLGNMSKCHHHDLIIFLCYCELFGVCSDIGNVVFFAIVRSIWICANIGFFWLPAFSGIPTMSCRIWYLLIRLWGCLRHCVGNFGKYVIIKSCFVIISATSDLSIMRHLMVKVCHGG